MARSRAWPSVSALGAEVLPEGKAGAVYDGTWMLSARAPDIMLASAAPSSVLDFMVLPGGWWVWDRRDEPW
ncbi:hypothetical protein NSZ01_30520 [Nocardioides szechwanensis]|nr:hypothetical protein NSZ01_30520 [Nocardioides szechwanensis]